MEMEESKVQSRELFFGSLAVQSGLTTLERVNESVEIQRKMRQMGIVPKKIAQIMVEKGYLTAQQAQHIMQIQKKTGIARDCTLECVATAHKKEVTFGSVAIEHGLTTLDRVGECLLIQQEMRTMGLVPKKIATIMVEKKYLTEEQAKLIMRAQARKRGGYVLIPGYKILSKLAQGAFGSVFRAVQVALDRPVAIKILPSRLAKDPESVERFRKEARIVAKMRHPNIVQCIDAGFHDGLYYMVMELIEGPTLEQVVEMGGPVGTKRAIEIMFHVGRALNHAQENGLVHRDIKPANIIIDDAGVAKLCDLGLARVVTEGVPKDEMGLFMGTPDYMPPEVGRGAPDIDIRADIYAFGATMYHAVTGRVPFPGKTVVEIVSKHMAEDALPPCEVNRSVPASLSDLLVKMMAKDRGKRVQSPRELLRELEGVSQNAMRSPVPEFNPVTSKTVILPVQPLAPTMPSRLQVLKHSRLAGMRAKRRMDRFDRRQT
jgi:serine/threonine protein kinase